MEMVVFQLSVSGFGGFLPPILRVNSQTIKLCAEALFEANNLSYILLSQPYTQVQWSISTIVCIFNPQVTLLRGSKLPLYQNFN